MRVDLKTISSAEKYKITTKRKDTGKWWGFGSLSYKSAPNKDQPKLSIGLRKTPELMQLIEATEDGGWINFMVFEDDKKPVSTPAEQRNYQPVELSDEIPF